MNKLFLTTILILCLPVATAVTMYAGNQENITLDFSPISCIIINEQNDSLIDYSIDGMNFTIDKNKVIINTHPALMPGTYYLYCDPTTKEITTTISSGGGGGSGGGGYASSWICGNWSECINNKIKRVCIQGTNKNINYTQSRKCVSETKEPEEKEEEEIKAEDETEIIGNITAVINKTETKDEKEDIPTKEDETWIYLGIIIITIMFIIFGWYILNRRSSSNSE